MQWVPSKWPIPEAEQPQGGQFVVMYYEHNPGDGDFVLAYWDATIKDWRWCGDVGHIYGGREPAYLLYLSTPGSANGDDGVHHL